ncbi:MAG: ribbon-helix-helix domain-containing protein [Gammaproteobacteria bacterium]|nr:ribbon-helix-helix domain-containing protein [Gammaproteobacteria bacterium]
MTKKVTITIDDELNEKLTAASEKAGISKSAYVHEAAIESLNPKKTEVKEVIVEKIIEKEVPVSTSDNSYSVDHTKKDFIATIIDESDTTTLVTWAVVAVGIVLILLW